MKVLIRKISKNFARWIYYKLCPKELLKLKSLFSECKITFNEKINIIKNNKIVILKKEHMAYGFHVMDYFDSYYEVVKPKIINEKRIVDYSQKSIHVLKQSGLKFFFPSLAESEESCQAYLQALQLNQGEVVLDLGAYAGTSTYFMSLAVGKNGKVIAFEPDAENFECLRKNIQLHNLENVILINKGVWTSTTVLEFEGDGSMGSSPAVLSNRKNNIKRVDVLSLHDAMAIADSNVDAIKMDIEGSELPIILGSELVLASHGFPKLVIEPHDIRGKMNTETIVKKLESLDYKCRLIFQKSQDWPLIAAVHEK